MKIKKRNFKNFILNLINRINRHDITTYSAALSFYLLQASIPLMMVLVNVLSYFLEGNEEVIYRFLELLPESSANLIVEALDILIRSNQSAAVTTLTILFALWSATSGINKLINAINHAYGLMDNRQAVKQRIMSVLFTIIFIILIVFLLIFQIYGSSILGILDAQIFERITSHFSTIIQDLLDMISSPIFKLITYVVPFLIMAMAIGVFYKYSPSNPKNRISNKEAFLGGLFATVAIFLSSFIYSFFINNFSNKSLVYGALAGILALFIWLLIISVIIILGAECIAAYREGYKEDFFKDKKKKKKSPIIKKIENMLKRRQNEK
ncbi:MAG: YihY/virulence factor BrkB family protein [Anaerococcus sp.]|nr:YihY/virulence factor BrkB family protein [Anaerococcus sp.]